MGRVEPNELETLPDGRVVVRIRPPENRPPAPITADTKTWGQRVVWCRPDGYHYDYRATKDPYPAIYEGQPRLMVDIVEERVWYDAVGLHVSAEALGAHAITVPASRVFLERPAAPDPTREGEGGATG